MQRTAKVFTAGDEVDGVYFLIQGEVAKLSQSPAKTNKKSVLSLIGN